MYISLTSVGMVKGKGMGMGLWMAMSMSMSMSPCCSHSGCQSALSWGRQIEKPYVAGSCLLANFKYLDKTPTKAKEANQLIRSWEYGVGSTK